MSEHRFRLAGYAPEPSEAVVDIETLGPDQRLARAFRGSAAWLGAGIVSVFIPIAHFVLVPACLLIAVIMGFVRMGQTALVRKAHGKCPDCGTDQPLDIVGPWRGPTDLVCRNCQRPMRMIPTT